MEYKQRIVTPDKQGKLIDERGNILTPPSDWTFLPAGDAGLTRKVTSQGYFWRVQIKKGRRLISKGIWAPTPTILKAKEEVDRTRETDAYKKKRKYDKDRREKIQENYKIEFLNAVTNYLHFDSRYKNMEKTMATAITQHAIPVGSGTVARTSMIPIEERAAKAVIAWMRHQTTTYDHLQIARTKGERRDVRHQLAQKSIVLLSKYRNGERKPSNCPLQIALIKFNQTL